MIVVFTQFNNNQFKIISLGFNSTQYPFSPRIANPPFFSCSGICVFSDTSNVKADNKLNNIALASINANRDAMHTLRPTPKGR